MVSEEKITSFLKLQQLALDIEDTAKLLQKLLPIVLQEMNLIGYPYVFASAIFFDDNGNIKKTFFIDKINNATLAEVIKKENLLKKGSEWEMKVMYGEAAVVSDVKYFINPGYSQISKINSLIMLPIQKARKLSGILILGSAKMANQADNEEIEFGEMITRLISLSFKLEDTEDSLTKITQQVYEMNAKLHQLDKLKNDFVSVASHELRTPMTAIKSYAWLALHRSDVKLSDKLEKYLIRVLISTERLINLVNDLLNISRIESGKIEITPEPVDLVSLIKDIIDEVYYSKSTEKKVKFEVLEKVVPKAFADPEKLRQVFLNLAGNSLKFTQPGGKITFDFFTDGNVVEVSVSDTGIGISKEDLSRLFQKFGRLDNSYAATASSGGTGLGLYISKNLVELMHGKIKANSKGINKGATFTVSLPVASYTNIKNAEKFTVRALGEVKPLVTV